VWFKTANLTWFDTETIFYNAKQAEFTGKEFLTRSKDIRIHSGFRSSLDVSSGNSVRFLMTDSLSLTGESLSFESGRNLLETSDGDLEFQTDLHGVLGSIEGLISIQALSELRLDLPKIHIESKENSNWFASEKLLSKSGGESRISSEEGHVGFYTTDTAEEGKISFDFGGNLTLAAGSKPGDLLSMKANTLRFLSDRLSVDVSGPLRFDLDGPIDVDAQGGVVFQIGNQFLMESPDLITEIGQSGLTLRGGNVNFTSTVAELRFIAGKLIALNSTDVSVASKELDQVQDGLFFSSNEHMTLNSQSSIVLFARDSVSIQTENTSLDDGGNGSGGSILLEGPSIEIASGKTNPEFENQSFRITTTGKEGILFKAGDHGKFQFKQELFIHADQSAKLTQSELFISAEELVHISSSEEE